MKKMFRFIFVSGFLLVALVLIQVGFAHSDKELSSKANIKNVDPATGKRFVVDPIHAPSEGGESDGKNYKNIPTTPTTTGTWSPLTGVPAELTNCLMLTAMRGPCARKCFRTGGSL